MKLFLCFGLILGFMINHVSAQQSDFGIWMGADIKKKISSRFSLDFSQQALTRENSVQIDKFFSQFGLNYKLSKKLKLSISYRLIQNKEIDFVYHYGNRLQTDLTLYQKIQNLKFYYRIRFQNQYADFFSSENGRNPKGVLRQRASLEYDFGRRIVPGISAEYFYDGQSFIPNDLSGERYRATVNYEINNKNQIQVFYQFQNKWNVKLPVNSYIIGFMYGFDL